MSGPRVIVTRPPAQAVELSAALRALGAVPLEVPLIAVEPLLAVAPPSGGFDVIVYVSRNAVVHGMHIGGSATAAPANATAVVVALGPATAAALERAGQRADIVAKPAGGSEALLRHEALCERRLRGRQVLIVKGQGGRALLRETLAARGADVTERDVYRRVPLPAAADALARCLAAGDVQSVVLTSVEIVEAWLASVPPARLGGVLSGMLHVVISERIAATLRAAGARRIVVAASTAPAVIAAAAIAA